MKNEILYEVISKEIKQLIESSAYIYGEKLPSIRRLSLEKNVSVATIQKALELLEGENIVRAVPRSGYFITKPAEPTKIIENYQIPLLPKTVEIQERASNVFQQCESKDVLDLGTGYPSSEYFPTETLKRLYKKMLNNDFEKTLAIHFTPQDSSLRRILADHLNKMACNVSSESMIITNGCFEALTFCLRAVAYPGDCIAVESPGFVGLFELIESLGLKAIEIPCTDSEGMSLEALELCLQQWQVSAVLVTPTHSNPTGSVMPEKNRQKLVQRLAEESIPLIEDDVFSDFSFSGSKLKPCKAFDKKGLVLYCSSSSKTIAPGLRVGWIATGAFYKEIAYFKRFTNVNVSSISQRVVAEFLNSGAYNRHVLKLAQVFNYRVNEIRSAVHKFFPKNTMITKPKGGYFLWIELPNEIDSIAFFNYAIENGVGFAPGEIFSNSGKYNNFIRINCAHSSNYDVSTTYRLLGKIAKDFLKKTSK